ncbi:hypothetical protein BDQ12DRAFT_717448 [Crucibulum laeve]|uniref:C2H2-type domain-containing protein n=1 Tax=Crucibulum laeve TaxID=68775 RepID=A0A5C3MHX3_9AGAR|nr:hypothetical protein BDQ12DRAFT_717448 [Crucibulum laeve]
MHRRDSHSYTYDEAPYYAAGHIPQQGTDYPMSIPYQQNSYDSTGYYVASPSSGNATEALSPSPYMRSMTPSLSQSHRYSGNTGRDPRYYQSQSVAASSSTLPVAGYSAQAPYYPSQHVGADHRSHPTSQANFIPTPSEMAHNYSSYSPMSHSSVSPEHYSSHSGDYPAPPHMVPSSHGSMHRPARISTTRPRTATGGASTSPTSASSPSGERFPCEKCGKTFSRSHDRKRHHETQHLPSPVIHRCRYCEKEFSRADSLKRHLDNGCDEMP